MKESKERQVRNGLIYLLPPVLSAIIPILTVPLFTRALSPKDFGAYALAQVYGLFVMGLINMGLTTAYERNFFEYRGNKKKQSELIYGVLICIFILFCAAMVCTWLLRNRLAALIVGSDQHALLLFWSTLAISVMSFKQYFLLYFRNTEDASAYARYSIDEMILNTAFSLMLVLVYKVGVLGLVVGQFIGSIIVLIVLIFKFFKKLTPSFSWLPIRDTLLLALPLTPISLTKVVGTQADKYLLGQLGSLGGVGLYSIGQRFGYLVFIWMTALQNVFSPQVYHRMFSLSAEEGARSIGSYITPYIYLSVGGALGMSLFAEEAILILTPSEYHGASNAATVLALYYATLFFGKIPQLTYARKTYISSFLSIVSTIITFLCCVIGIKIMGVMGSAWGLLIAGVLTNAIIFYIGQRHYFIQWEVKRILGIFGYLFGSAFIVLILRSYGIGLIVIITLKIMMILGFLLIGRMIGFLSRENIIACLRVISLRK